MATIEIEVSGEKKKLYVDNRLHHNLIQKVMPNLQKRDKDILLVIDGPERSGKSVFAMQVAKVIDPTFDIQSVCMTPEAFRNAVLTAKKGQAIIYDEAFTGLSSRASLSEINKLLVELMMEMGQKNLFILIVMPTFFMLEKYVALFRATGLFHVYLKRGQRGRWVFFNKKRKKLLYLNGKKLFDYSYPRSNFKGRFLNTYVIDEGVYREKKRLSLSSKSRNTRVETIRRQRDILFYILNKKFNQSQNELSILCKDFKFKIDRSTISDSIHNIEKYIQNFEINSNQEKFEDELKEDFEPKN